MLPFLKSRKETATPGLMIKIRQPDQPPEKNEDMSSAAVEECAKDIMSAIASKDHKALASALADVFAILDAEPHEEGPHIEPHSYDSQKD